MKIKSFLICFFMLAVSPVLFAQEPVTSSLPKSMKLSINGADIAYCSAPVWFAHGAHGFYQRWKNYITLENNKKENIHSKSFFPRLENFSKYHPVQSVRLTTPKIRKFPIVGPLVATYLTGFAWHTMFADNENKK